MVLQRVNRCCCQGKNGAGAAKCTWFEPCMLLKPHDLAAGCDLGILRPCAAPNYGGASVISS